MEIEDRIGNYDKSVRESVVISESARVGGIIRSAEAGNRQGGREEGRVARLLGRWPPRFTSTIRNNDFSHKDMIDNFGEYSFD